jgi:hypothetical protein
MFIFLDESGEMGFSFDDKQSSKYFVITLLTCENPQAIKFAVKRTLNKVNAVLKKPSLTELKGANTKLKFKQFFLQQLIEDTSWAIHCVVLDKQALQRNAPILPTKDRLYNTMAKRALEQIPFKMVTSHINLSVDRSKRRKEIAIFNDYIISNLEISLALDTNFNIEHECSHNNPGLQAVDLFCWGIYRKYEHGDATWYDLFKHRIVSEEVYTR